MRNLQQLSIGLGVALAIATPAAAQDSDESAEGVRALVREVRELRGEVERLNGRVHELEGEQVRGSASVSELSAEIGRLRDATGLATSAAPRSVLTGPAGFHLSGLAEMIYSYNPRAGGDPLDKNRFRAGDNNANSFALQTVQLVLEKEATTAGTWGLRLQAEYGRLAELIDADENFDGGSDNAFSLSEWFVTWRTKGLFGGTDDYQAGRFQTPLGFESNENNRNVMVTRNPIYQLGTPTTHTGARAAFSIAPDLTATVYLVNGWDNQINANGGETALLSVASTPIADWYGSAFTFNASYGHEGSDTGHLGDKTSFAEFLWTTEPDECWSTVLDVIWATTEDGVARGGLVEDRDWHGAAGYVTRKFGDDVQLSGRLGYYSDSQFKSGTIRMLDASIAVRYLLAQGLTVMLEFRHDWSSSGNPYFSDSGSGREDVQDTVTASVMVEF